MTFRLREARRLALGLALGIGAPLLLVACPGPGTTGTSQETPGEPVAWRCEEPRPEHCPALHDPVCAQRDTGIRCVTTPCDASEAREYPSACRACRDPLVLSYRRGRC